MKTFDVTNPATGEVIGRLKSDTPAIVAKKFRAARAAQPLWASKSLKERLRIIARFRALLVEGKETLAITLTREVGKPISQSRNELDGVLGRIDFFAANAEEVLNREKVSLPGNSTLQEEISHEPLGIIANISAWNYPYFVGSNVFVPALLAGNAVLYKPSEFASLTGQAIARLLHKSGVPKAVFALVLGPGDVGAMVVNQPIDGIYFTGSVATGRRIAALAAGRMIRLQLELGGKDPVYVCEDAGAARAAGIADGAFYNAGQSCCSVERIYVHRRLYQKFVNAFVTEVKGYRLGDPMADTTYIGPLARPAQLTVLENQVADAVKRGATVLTGGKRAAGRPGYFEPTVLVNVTHDMAIMREESFGPVIGIMAVKSDAEAIRLMNDSEYGLTAAVYTSDEKRARRILAELDCGSAYWNCCDRVSPALPWSGVGESGMGVTLSKTGIETFTRPKAWHLRSQ